MIKIEEIINAIPRATRPEHMTQPAQTMKREIERLLIEGETINSIHQILIKKGWIRSPLNTFQRYAMKIQAGMP